MKNAKMKQMFLLPITQRLKAQQDSVYKEVLAFARKITGKPDLQGTANYPEFEHLCDALFLIRSGAIKCTYLDGLDGEDQEVIALELCL